MRYALTESQLYYLIESEDDGIKNIVSKSYNDNPEKFTENLVDEIPQLKKQEKGVQRKVSEVLMNNTSKIAIIGLLSIWISVQLPSVMKNGFFGNKTEQSDFSKSDSLNLFVKKFVEQNPNWGLNNKTLEISEDKIRKDFIEYVNQGNLSNYPLKLSAIRNFDENRSIIVFGRREHSDSLSVEFVSIVPNNLIGNFKVGDSCLFNFSVKTYEWGNLYTLAKKYDLNLWSPTNLRKGNPESNWSLNKSDEFNLGFYLTKVNSIQPVEKKQGLNKG